MFDLRNMLVVAAVVAFGTAGHAQVSYIQKLGQDLELRSGARILADDTLSGKVILPDAATPVQAFVSVPQLQLRGANVQANDPAMDYIQVFSGFRPFVHTTQSETSTAAFGRNIVVGYNN